MDGQQQPESAAAAPEKQPRHSFMDVRRPKPKDESTPAASPEQKTAEPSATEEKVTAAPPEDKAQITDDPAGKLAEPEKPKPAKAPKPPKAPRQPGVNFAIFATIVIILGLGALATYAYLRTNNIAPF